MAATVQRLCLAMYPSSPEDVGASDEKRAVPHKPSAPIGSRAVASRHSAFLRLRERQGQRQDYEVDMTDFCQSPKGTTTSESCEGDHSPRKKDILHQSSSGMPMASKQLNPRLPTEPRNPKSARPSSTSLQYQSACSASFEVVSDSLRPSRPPPNTQGRSVIAALRQVRIDEARRKQRVAEVQSIGERRSLLEEVKTQEVEAHSSKSSSDTAGAAPAPAEVHQEVEPRSPARLVLQQRAEMRRAVRTPEPAIPLASESLEQEAGKQTCSQSAGDEHLERHCLGGEEAKKLTPISRSLSCDHDSQDGTLSMASTASTFRPARSATSTPYGTDDDLDDTLSPVSRDALSPGPAMRCKPHETYSPERDGFAPMCLAESVGEVHVHEPQTPDTKPQSMFAESASEPSRCNQTCGCPDLSEQEEAALAILRKRQAARHVARGQAVVETLPHVSKCPSPEPCMTVEQTLVKSEQDDAGLDVEDVVDRPSSRPVTRCGRRGDIVTDHLASDASDRPHHHDFRSADDCGEDFFGCELARDWPKYDAGGESQRERIGLPLPELLDYSMPPCDAAIALGVSDEGQLERWSNSSSDSWNCYFDKPGELELCDQRLPSRELYVILEEVEMGGRPSYSDWSSHYCCPDLLRRVCTSEFSCDFETDVPVTSVCDLPAQGETSLPQMAYERRLGDNCFFVAHAARHSATAKLLCADDASQDLAHQAKERQLLEKYDIAMEEDIEWSAAIHIQAAYRRYCKGKQIQRGACNEVVDERPPSSEEVRRAAVISTAKSLVALRSQVQREAEWTAALRVQTCWRGHSVRRRYIAQRILTPNSSKKSGSVGISSSLLREGEVVECEQADLKATTTSFGCGDEHRHLMHRRVRKQNDSAKSAAPSRRPPSRPSSVGRRPMVSDLLQKEESSREKLPKLLAHGCKASGSTPSIRAPAVAGKIPASPRVPEGVAKVKSLQMPLLAVATSTDSTAQVCSLPLGSCSTSPRLAASPRRQWG